MLLAGITLIVAGLLGAILYVNDVGWLAVIIWPVVLLLQCATWYFRGRNDEAYP